jgi:hypothetical protein
MILELPIPYFLPLYRGVHFFLAGWRSLHLDYGLVNLDPVYGSDLSGSDYRYQNYFGSETE